MDRKKYVEVISLDPATPTESETRAAHAGRSRDYSVTDKIGAVVPGSVVPREGVAPGPLLDADRDPIWAT